MTDLVQSRSLSSQELQGKCKLSDFMVRDESNASWGYLTCQASELNIKQNRSLDFIHKPKSIREVLIYSPKRDNKRWYNYVPAKQNDNDDDIDGLLFIV